MRLRDNLTAEATPTSRLCHIKSVSMEKRRGEVASSVIHLRAVSTSARESACVGGHCSGPVPLAQTGIFDALTDSLSALNCRETLGSHCPRLCAGPLVLL